MRKTIAFTCSILAAASSLADSYQVTIPDADAVAIANHLNHGGNTLNELFPNVADGSMLLKWDCATGDFGEVSFCSGTGHWSPNLTLVPGEGAVLENNDTVPVTITFTGTPQIPSLPPPLPCGCDHSYLLSSQTASAASWESIVGAPPANGALFIRFDFNSPGYWVTNAYIGCRWTNGTPTATVGESVRLFIPCSSNTCCEAGTVSLNTGFNHPGGAVYPIGAADAFWRVVADPENGTTEPRDATVILPIGAWKPAQANSQWISSYPTASDESDGDYDFQTSFCLNEGWEDVELNVCVRADDWAEVFLGGNLILTTPNPSFNTATPSCVTVDSGFVTGANTLLIRVHNSGGEFMGLNVSGSVTGTGLSLNKPECCQPGASLSGQKFNDLNGNGVRDTGEPGLAGWTIHLSNGQNAVTDAKGYYYFMDLAPGTYTVTEVQQPGWTQTSPASGSSQVTLGMAQSVNGVNFGNRACVNRPTDKTVQCGSMWSFDPPGPSDICCPDAPVIVLISSNVVTFLSPCHYSIEAVWHITDCQSDSAYCTQTVTVVDTTPPVFCGAPPGPNLVPNPGFETYSACPDGFSEINRATPWFQATLGTSDFFHSCDVGGIAVGVPGNFAGIQLPQSGSGYAGFYAYHASGEYREYIETPLSSPLVPGHTYEVSFYVSLGDYCNFAVDNVGAFFSVGPSPSGGSFATGLNPQVRSPAGTPLVSKTDWMPVKGSYTALGGENYLTIGNFQHDLGAPIFPAGGGSPSQYSLDLAYYYADEVSVSEPGTNCCGNKTVQYGTPWAFARPVAFDSCCTNTTVTLLSSNLISSTPPCQSVFQGVWQATDCCSNSAYCTQTVTVVDSIAPYLCCPNDITVYTCSNSFPVKWKVTVTDNATSGLQATCNPPSGSLFPIGTTTVACTATDACGNVGTCSFKVTVVGNQLAIVTKTLGVNDCYKAGNETAPVPKSATLLSLPGPWKLFDETTVGKRFGASFMRLSNDVQCAQLWLRMKPNCRASNHPLDDTLSLVFTNHPPGLPQAAWTRYIGGGNPSPGLITSLWCQQTGCAQLFSLDLANLPNGGANLLPLINSQHRLDILVEDATTVDYAQLCYCYCPGKPLWRGLEWQMANAAFLRNCADTLIVSRDVFTNFTVGVSPGEMRGINLVLRPLSLAGAAVKSIVVTGQRTLDESPDSIRVSGNSGGVTTFSLAALRTNVTQIQVTVRNGTNVVAQSNLPLTPGTNLLAVTGDPLLTGIGSTSGGSAYQFTFESSHPVAILNGAPVSGDSIELLMIAPSSSSENLLGSLTLDVAGLDEIELTDALVQAGALSPRIQGDAVATIAGDVLTISSLNLTTNNPIGVKIGLGARPTDPIWILPTINRCRLSIVGPSVHGTTSGYIGNEPVPFRLGDVTFVVSTNGWSISGDFANLSSSGTRYQVLNQGAMVVDTGNSAVAAADASDLPNQWRLSTVQSQGHFIFNWPETQTFTVNSNVYFGDEMRLLPLGTNLPAYSLASLSVLAVGVESLTLSTEVPSTTWTLQTPLVTPTQMTIQWDGPSGGTLESSPTVFGPWTIVPGQDGNSAILGSPLTNGQPTQFFRVRSN